MGAAGGQYQASARLLVAGTVGCGVPLSFAMLKHIESTQLELAWLDFSGYTRHPEHGTPRKDFPARCRIADNGRMSDDAQSRWVIREEASQAIIIALYVRQALGIRGQHELPTLRNAPIADSAPSHAERDALEHQWRQYWNMTVEPLAHTHAGPLDLVDGFSHFVALPVTGADELRAALVPLAPAARAYAAQATQRYLEESSRRGGESRRPYVNAISAAHRATGRPMPDFELTVEVPPLSQRGVWWIGTLTVAITDSVRSDVVAFDSALATVVEKLG